MDGQNFENENNVTVDTTATEVSSTAEPAQKHLQQNSLQTIIKTILLMYSLR